MDAGLANALLVVVVSAMLPLSDSSHAFEIGPALPAGRQRQLGLRQVVCGRQNVRGRDLRRDELEGMQGGRIPAARIVRVRNVVDHEPRNDRKASESGPPRTPS